LIAARWFIFGRLTELPTMRTAVLVPLAAIGALSIVGSVLGQGSDNAVVFKEEGQASYYGRQFHGRATASGKPFDQNAMTAAHPKLPLGSEVTVTDPATGRQVEVEVNDRGPYAKGRDIDLSQRAAKKLGITQEGVAKVTIEATKRQVEEAIDQPKDAPKVERQLEEARRASAAEGTPQPKPLPSLDPPPGRDR
jgi:rare lipoprotein A